jgi:uncharacterized damage-inducible protein DinB
MNRQRCFAVVAAALCTTLLTTNGSAQATSGSKGYPPPDPNAAMTALRNQWQGVTRNIQAAAEEMSEADYAYRPIASVRTFGELIAHVAGSQSNFCAAAMGNANPPAEDAIEKTMTKKADLVAALKASTIYCTQAFQQTPTAGNGSTMLFGELSSRYNALALTLVHNGEHYGNIVTYMRMKGMVPPSSKR